MKLSARFATSADADILLAWRNDPTTRENSREADLITFEEHSDWLGRVLNDSTKNLFIIESDENGAVGTVRFDKELTGVFEVSITVNPQFRGKGYGTRILLCAEEELHNQTFVKIFRAFVKNDNVASVKLFEAAGYLRSQNAWWVKGMESYV